MAIFGQIRVTRREIPGRFTLAALVLGLGISVLGTSGMLASAQTSMATATTTATTTTDIASCPPATPASGTEATDRCVKIGEYDVYYNPNLVTIPSETPVRFILTNHGEATHNFSVTGHQNAGLENLNISITNDPGQSDEAIVNAPEGSYYFFCNQPGHEQAGMRGYITIAKDAEVTTAEATVTPRAG
jgi:uncharacterized cupredoxin-like copper-binding protein